jgi:hypothetical protein
MWRTYRLVFLKGMSANGFNPHRKEAEPLFIGVVHGAKNQTNANFSEVISRMWACHPL